MRVKQQVLSICISLCATFANAAAMPVASTDLSQSMTSTSIVSTFIQNVTGIQIGNIPNPVVDIRAQNIDNYFAQNNLPLTGYGKVFVQVADKYNLDYRLLPAIAMRESTGGKKPCPNDNDNVFGWASCKTQFDSQEQAIDKVGAHLAGAIKSTSYYYGNKSVWGKLRTYNSVIKKYPDQVVAIMYKIDDSPITEQVADADLSSSKDIALK